MYIGLFLIAPFLNLAFNKLKTKKQRQVLVLTFIGITTLFTAFNIFDFSSMTWWTNPIESNHFQKLLIVFWKPIYPVTYYFTGMYLREYGLKIKTRSLVALLSVTVVLCVAFHWFRCEGSTFNSQDYGDWNGIMTYTLTVMVFELLRRINADNFNVKVRTVLWKLSDLALGAYLMSYVSDMLIYKVLNSNVHSVTEKLPYYFVVVPLSFIMALLFSFILNLIEKLIMKIYYAVKNFVVKQREKDRGLHWQDLLFILLFLGVLLFSGWKLNYGFGGNDEAFYQTISYRFCLGDAMFADEWNLSQLSGFLLLPFTWLYTTITGSTEGILLAARITYLLVHAAAAVVIYLCIRKKGYFAMFGTILYFIYTPFDIMALSYDSMGVELVVLTGVLLGTADYDKKLRIIFSGVCFAGAVLCNPFLAAAYPLYAVCMVIHILIRKKEMRFALKSRIFAPRTFLWFTIGAAGLGIVFLIFTLSRVSIADILKNLPYMLNDPEHMPTPFIQKIGNYFVSIFNCRPLFKYAVYAYGVTLIALIFDKNRKLHRGLYLIISAVLSCWTLIVFLPDLWVDSYNYIMFAPIFVSITSYILCDKKPRELFVGLFCFGVFYSFCCHYASNQTFHVISMAMTAANLAGFVFLGQLIKEMRETKDNLTYAAWTKAFAFILIGLMVFHQGVFEISAKANHVFWDASPKDLNTEMSAGPAKGIITTQSNADTYMAYYKELKRYLTKEEGNVLFITPRTWMYLAADGYPYGTYSAWLSGHYDSTVLRLKEYYSLNPEKIPKYVYVPKDTKCNFDAIVNEAKANGYTVKESNLSYFISK